MELDQWSSLEQRNLGLDVRCHTPNQVIQSCVVQAPLSACIRVVLSWRMPMMIAVMAKTEAMTPKTIVPVELVFDKV
jgi:hypothetical protein